MIENLPDNIEFIQLSRMNFGNIEANDDILLFDSICKTTSMLEFLNGTKSIVLGEKGTGKTALFRLLKEDKIKFDQTNGFKNLIIPIEDNFEYKNIKAKLAAIIGVNGGDEHFKYQIIWELYLYKKIVDKIKIIELPLTENLKNSIKLCNDLLNSSTIDTFIKSKKTFGVKLYDASTTILPDFYFSTEPVLSKENTKEDAIDKLEVDLDLFKKEVNEILKENNYKLIILIDRLDEFISKSVLETQIEMLEALVATEREFGRYSNIDLKIFLRDDLFKQLKFEGIGFDKVITKKIDLIWTPEKIREFIAKRLRTNYINIFNLSTFKIFLNNESLEIDTSVDTIDYVKPIFYVRWYRIILKKINKKHYEQKFPRKVNLNDNISKEIILTFFPRYVDCHNAEGRITEIDIFDFFGTMFNLGTGNTIPRLILIFLDKLMSIAKNYYQNNFDKLPISATPEGCFEIFKKGFFEKAYDEFKSEIYINYAKLNPEFEQTIMLFKEKIGNKYSLKPRELKNMLGFKNDDEIIHFCNYLLHIGMLHRTNNTNIITDMKFELPLMFRNVK